MKMPVRLLTAILIASMLFSGAAFAEINFDDYTVEELMALKSQIHTEIIKRRIDDTTVRVPMGTYTVGIDIPAGSYTLTGGSDVAMITLYSPNGDIITFHSLYFQDKIGRIDLESGQKVEIQFGGIIFMTYRGIGF